jgi:CheY-like chemotaxis protein
MSRILAIEPDTDRAVLLEQLVRESVNSELILATSTDAAIAAMAGQPPDLILTSMLLPAHEEHELVAHLRAAPSLRHIPVLTIPAVSGMSASETGSTGFLARFRRRRQPPVWPMYNFNAVITRIEEALEQSTIAKAQAEAIATELAIAPVVEPSTVAIVEPSTEEIVGSIVAAEIDEPLVEQTAGLLEPEVASSSRKRARRLRMSDVPWLSTVKLSWGQKLRLLNISSSGVLVESGVRLAPGSTTEIELDGPGLALAVPARVVRCRVSEVDSLGVKYETAAMFEHPVEELLGAEQEPVDTAETLASLVAAVKANAASGMPQVELRAAFEHGVLDLITAHDVRLRDVPVVENDGRESIYFTVPALEESRAVLQVTFNANDAPRLADFDVLTAAARAAAEILPLTGVTRQATVPASTPTPALRLVGGNSRKALELQIA